MPWSNQGGGGGPWRNNPGPWGSGPQSSGPTPPDLEELLRRSQDRLKTVLPGGGFGGRGILVLVAVAVLAWLASGFYRVEPDEQGVVLRFGRFVETTQPGLNYHLPYPIETVLTPSVTTQNSLEVGMRSGVGRTAAPRDVPQESLMLTGDGNIVDVNFAVVWVIKNAPDFLFNIQNQEATIKAVAESAMREVVGRNELQNILTEGTPAADAPPPGSLAAPAAPAQAAAAAAVVAATVKDLMQRTLDSYGAGVEVTQVQLQKIAPPAQVIDAFRDVQAAQQDRLRLRNEAQAYANRVVPEARGQASQILQAAEGYKARSIAEAQGQTSRFGQIYDEYAKAPDVTRGRMFLETMERVLGGADKIIVDKEAGNTGVVPYLPLEPLQQRPETAPAPQARTRGGVQ